jgi:hypothetical protein
LFTLREHYIFVNMEHEWLYNALDKIEENYQINSKWITNNDTNDVDGRVVFTVDNHDFTWNVEIKNELRNHQLDQIKWLAEKHKPLMVIARRIFPKLKEFLRENDIAYLEGNGNIFLKKGKTYIFIDGNKPLDPEKEATNKAFTKTGLRLIFEILLDETVINMPYRTMAEKAKIALGNVNNIMNALKEQGYLLKTNKEELKVMNKKQLFDKWVTLYLEKLKPGLKIGTFRFVKEEDFNKWRTIGIVRGKTWWGGEPAGDLLTNYLKPGRLTLYTKETRVELIRHYRLVPDENGNVEIYEAFWNTETTTTAYTPVLLIYTDLMNTGDPRCTETAKKLYDEYIAGQF